MSDPSEGVTTFICIFSSIIFPFSGDSTSMYNQCTEYISIMVLITASLEYHQQLQSNQHTFLVEFLLLDKVFCIILYNISNFNDIC